MYVPRLQPFRRIWQGYLEDVYISGGLDLPTRRTVEKVGQLISTRELARLANSRSDSCGTLG